MGIIEAILGILGGIFGLIARYVPVTNWSAAS